LCHWLTVTADKSQQNPQSMQPFISTNEWHRLKILHMNYLLLKWKH